MTPADAFMEESRKMVLLGLPASGRSKQHRGNGGKRTFEDNESVASTVKSDNGRPSDAARAAAPI
eukprot:7448897-Heterocapsa_arctica.AAC.1